MAANLQHAIPGVQAPAFIEGALNAFELAGFIDRWHAAGMLGPVRVQFWARGMVRCGIVEQVVIAGYGDDWINVREDGFQSTGVYWAKPHQVRLCTGDGRCTCGESVAAQAAQPRAAADSAPLGNTGVTA